jgi:hypothetical protein
MPPRLRRAWLAWLWLWAVCTWAQKTYEELIWDVTQEFTHADMMEEVYTRLPHDVHGLDVQLSSGHGVEG